MCGGGGGKTADEYYEEMDKPEKQPLPSLSMAKRGSREPKYGGVKVGQKRRNLLMPYGVNDE